MLKKLSLLKGSLMGGKRMLGSQMMGSYAGVARNSLLRYQQCFMSGQTSLQRDLEKLKNSSVNSLKISKGDSPSKKKYLDKIKDYELEFGQDKLKVNLNISEEQMKENYPTEYFVHQDREEGNVYLKLEENQLLLTNLHEKLTEEELRKVLEKKIKKFNLKVSLFDLTMISSLKEGKAAYCIVTVSSALEVEALSEKFKDHWHLDRLIKARSSEDRKKESFDNRTIVVRNIPDQMKTNDVVEQFSQLGAVVSVEMPSYNRELQHLSYKVGELDPYSKEKEGRKEKEYAKAMNSLKERLSTDEEYLKYLEENFGTERTQVIINSYLGTGKEEASRKELLADYSIKNIKNLAQQLSFEGTKVGSSILLLESLKDGLLVQKGELEQGLKPEDKRTQEQWQEDIDKHHESLEHILKYIQTNQEVSTSESYQRLSQYVFQAEPNVGTDAISRLQRLSRQELAVSYDYLIQFLDQRMQLIEKRLNKEVERLSRDEKVLFEHTNPELENEDLPIITDPFEQDIKVEDFLSIKEQITNIRNYRKELTLEERIQLRDGERPFQSDKVNFERADIEKSQNKDTEQFRINNMPLGNKSPTFDRMFHSARPYDSDVQEMVDQRVENLRQDMDLPFEEIYHKEKNMVQEVILAEKALREKEKDMPNPMGDRVFNLKEVAGEVLYDSDFEDESQFLREQRMESSTILKEGLSSESSPSMKFEVGSSAGSRRLFYESDMSQKDIQRMKSWQKENRDVNLGYAFITFSHADEAKMAVYSLTTSLLEGMFLEVFPKSNLDHQDMDDKYATNRARNDANLVEELQNVREAKRRLGHFEKNIEQDLPSLKKLKEFRESAKELIEDHPYRTRELNEYRRRFRDEEENLKDKIRELQKKNPHIDYTELFENEKTEMARKSMHKKAFASYKAFEFLKQGIEIKKARKEVSQPQPMEEDPYNFPPLEKSISNLLTSDNARALRTGSRLQTRGRQFQQNPGAFLEAFYGKDGVSPDIYSEHEDLFGLNESLKDKYPIDKLKQVPVISRHLKKFQDQIDHHGDEMQKEVTQKTMAEENEEFFDKEHPTEKGRTFFGDWSKKMDQYTKSDRMLPEIDGDEVYSIEDLNKIRMRLQKEYRPVQKKKVEQAPPPPPVDVKQDEKFETDYEEEGTPIDKEELRQEVKEAKEMEEDEEIPGQVQEEVEIPQSMSYRFRNRKGKLVTLEFEDPTKPPQKQQNTGANLVEKEQYDAMVQLEDASLLPHDIRQSNKEWMYELRFLKERGIKEDNDKQLKKYKEIAELNGVTLEELLEQFGDFKLLNEKAQGHRTGYFKESVQSGHDTTTMKETTMANARTKGVYVDLSQVISDSEEEDIYQKYQERLKKERTNAFQLKEERRQEQKMKKMEGNEEMEKHVVDKISLEEYFEEKSQGREVYDKYRLDFDEELDEIDAFEEGMKSQQQIELEDDEQLRKREFMGRMMGENLSYRQLGVLQRSQEDQDSSATLSFLKNSDRESFLDKQDMIRLLEESLEQTRRSKVLSGEWTEAESQEKLHQLVKENQMHPMSNPEHRKRVMRHMEILIRDIKELPNPGDLIEQEYHFDEGLGQSLTDHVKELKEKMPGLEVMTRRDRDGFALVKVKMQLDYKYKVKDVMEFDADKEQDLVKESQDLILQQLLGENPDKESIETILLNSDNQFDLDFESKKRAQELVGERMHGKFRNDKDGFLREFLKFKETATYDETNPVSPQMFSFTSEQSLRDQAYEKLYSERLQISAEYMEQVNNMIKEHLYLKERKKSDFVRPKVSEAQAFRDQVLGNERQTGMLQLNMDKLVKEKGDGDEERLKGFDKEEFKKIKEQIKMKKEAKQRLLKQGFPELQPYVTV